MFVLVFVLVLLLMLLLVLLLMLLLLLVLLLMLLLVLLLMLLLVLVLVLVFRPDLSLQRLDLHQIPLWDPGVLELAQQFVHDGVLVLVFHVKLAHHATIL